MVYTNNNYYYVAFVSKTKWIGFYLIYCDIKGDILPKQAYII
jgi:hypothetical protein